MDALPVRMLLQFLGERRSTEYALSFRLPRLFLLSFRPRHQSGIGGCEIGPVNASQKDDCQVRQKNMQPLLPKQGLGGSRLVGDYHGPSSGSNYSIGL